MTSATTLTCTTCGRTAPADGRVLLAWVRGREAGRETWTCDICSRKHLRSIEGKLDTAWW